MNVDKARSVLDDVYAQIRESGEAVSAERIWIACEYLSTLKVARITATAVGDYCTTHFGGPRAQSIRNKTNTLAELVRRWDALHSLKSGKTTGSRSRTRSRFVVDDPTAIAYINLLEEKVQALEAKVRRLSKGFRLLEPLQMDRAPKDLKRKNSLSIHQTPDVPSRTERESVQCFLTRTHLANFDLHFDDRNRIKQGRRVLMERPVVELLLKLSGDPSAVALELPDE